MLNYRYLHVSLVQEACSKVFLVQSMTPELHIFPACASLHDVRPLALLCD
jgi:hypothetical protein